MKLQRYNQGSVISQCKIKVAATEWGRKKRGANAQYSSHTEA